MTWQLAVALKIVGGYMLAPAVFRLLGDVPTRERVYRILLQYAWAMLFAAGVALAGGLTFSKELWPIFLIGFLMPLTVFFQWRAVAYSISRTALFLESGAAIPLALSGILFGEWRVFEGNTLLIVGFALTALGIGLHAWWDIRNRHLDTALPLAFYGNALGCTVLLALATFLQNVWAKTGTGVPEFLVAWYGGALAGAALFFALTRHLPATSVAMPVWKEQSLIFLAAVSIVLNLSFMFVAFTLVEQTVALPIMTVGGLAGPIIVGMLFFKEWRTIRGIAWLYLAVAFFGALVMALSR